MNILSLVPEIQYFPKKWKVVPFDKAFDDITGGNAKIKQSDYKHKGLLPVIDQGKEHIAGYVDDLDLRCQVPLPVVLFGDHTKIFKFVTAPFALGADGVKVLAPCPDLDAKFGYYYLQLVRFPSDTGYSRHFKYLKEVIVPLPSFEDQRRIAAILDKADATRSKRQESIRLTEEFLRSDFLDMFGDPTTNPKRWKFRQFADVGTLDRGVSKHRPRNAPELLGGPYPLIQTGDVANSDGYIRTYKSTYSELGLKQSKMWPTGTLCITIAANIAKTGILTFDACFPDSVVGFTPNQLVTTEYVQYWLGFLQKTLEDNAPESAQKNINLEILRDLDIPLPATELQRQFTDKVKAVEDIKDKLREAFTQETQLFQSLTQRAFKGEL